MIAALAKQLGVDQAAVERIFNAGVDHAERVTKRRRLSQATSVSEPEPATPAASSAAPAPGAAPEAPAPGQAGSATAGFTFTAGVTLEQIRAELSEFAVQRDWDQFHSPRNLALALVGEVGELCEIFQWRGEVPEGLPGWAEKDRTHLGQELADVFLYLLRLSHKCKVDLPQAALQKLAVNAAKYPADLVRGSSRKYNEYKVLNRSGPSKDP